MASDGRKGGVSTTRMAAGVNQVKVTKVFQAQSFESLKALKAAPRRKRD